MREQVPNKPVRAEVVDVIHLVSIVFGGFAVAVSFLRSHVLGGYGLSIYVLCMLGVLSASWMIRAKVSRMSRSVVVLATLMLVAFGAMLHMGIYAAGAVLIPASVAIGWLIWPRRAALVLSVVGLFGFWGGACLHLTGMVSIPYDVGAFDHSLAYWLNLFSVYVLLGVLIYGVTRVLLRQVDSGIRRAVDGENQARADQQRLAEILRGIHDAVFLHDPATGLVVEVFGRVQEMYGFSPQELIGWDVQKLSADIPPWTALEARSWIDRAVAEGVVTFPWRARRADGSLFWVEVTIRPIRLVDGERILVTVCDVDSFLCAQKELASLNADLESRVEQRTHQIQLEREAAQSFAYAVSHDLRAPLRAIDGFTKILREDFRSNLPEEALQALERIEAGTERMGKLIEAMLVLTRLSRHAIHLSRVGVRQLVEEVHEELRLGGGCRRKGGCDCRVTWEIGELPDIDTDLDLARQVFANLLSNACKFSHSRENPVIRVEAIERSDGMWFVVSDNGIGFDMAYAGKLFVAFQRLHGESIDGIGIGLATVKNIVDRLGGAIEAEGVVDGGAVFRFRLGAFVPGHSQLAGGE